MFTTVISPPPDDALGQIERSVLGLINRNVCVSMQIGETHLIEAEQNRFAPSI